MLNHLISHIVKTTHTAVRIYQEDSSYFGYYGGHPDQDSLKDAPALLEQIIRTATEDIPVIFSENESIYYGVVLYQKKFIIAGPVMFDFSDQSALSEHYAVYCDYALFCEELLLLHNLLNNKNAVISEVTEYNFGSADLCQNLKRELGRVYFHYQENGMLHNPYEQEVRELNSIRSGDLERLKESMNEVFDGRYATLSRNPLRSAINLAIVTLALTARAAIDGGMLPEDSFSLNDSYILQVDAATSAGQIWELVRRAKIEYTTIVNKLHTSSGTHFLIEKVKNLIHQQMHQKILVRNLAKELEVSPEYLSALFHREEGITVTDYIMKLKIQFSENLLIYSNYSLDEISYYFGFCSQSHYGKIFKKWKHMSPKQFRDRYGNRRFIDEFEKIRK